METIIKMAWMGQQCPWEYLLCNSKEDLQWKDHVWIVDCKQEGFVMEMNLADLEPMDSLVLPLTDFHVVTQSIGNGIQVSARLSVRIAMKNVEHVTFA